MVVGVSLTTVKFLAALATFGIALLGGLIPLLAAREPSSGRFFSLGNAFAGGLFLGVGFMHLMPEGFEQLAAIDYPLGALMVGLGFAGLLLVDRVVVNKRRRPEDGAMRSPYAFVLLGLLSVHSVIAGVLLGLEEHLYATLVILLGVLCHKGSAGFALMVSAHGAGLTLREQRAVLATFAAMTPVGVLVGMFAADALHGNLAAAAPLSGVFNTLAAGTFIYVAVFHIIDAELTTGDARKAWFVCCCWRQLPADGPGATGSEGAPLPTADPDRVAKLGLVIGGLAAMALLAALHTH